MGYFYIIDSGRPNTDYSGSDFTDIANSGNKILIKVDTINYKRNQSVDSSVTPSQFGKQDVSPVSTPPTQFTVNFVIDRTSSTEMALIPYYDKLCETKGTKLLFYDTNSDSVWKGVITALGDENKDDAHKTLINTKMSTGSVSYSHLHVIVTNFSVSDSITSKMRCTLELVITR